MSHRGTLDSTLAPGAAADLGWRDLEVRDGEPTIGALDPAAIPLAALWHLSDVHLCDAESPARQEYLDRYADPDSPYREQIGAVGTYRPQEILTVQVATAMVETVNDIRHGPILGQPIEAVLVTGDVIDNAQRNELGWYRTIMGGGTVQPCSGDPAASSWVGAAAVQWSDAYWHPDGPPTDADDDRPTRLYGFPRIPGLVEAARRDVTSPGLALPLLTVHGNHDRLLQGSTVATDELRALAIGDERIVGLADGQSPLIAIEAVPGIGPSRYTHDASSPRTAVPPDPEREIVHPGDFGPTRWVRDIGRIRLIALDTVNPHGGWQGSLDREQFTWLQDQLARADRPVVITSHHPLECLINGYVPAGEPARILQDEVRELALSSPHVAAWVAGHVHTHMAIRHGTDERCFWEITTASLIDWPQQGRVLEFALESDDTVAIVSTVYDHSAPATWSAERLDSHRDLAAISRVLAVNDYRYRHDGVHIHVLYSQPEVRNAVWRARLGRMQ